MVLHQSRTILGCLAAGIALLAGFAVVPATAVRAEQAPALSKFMRQKLDSSTKILEGLTTEDDSLLAEGAGELLKMSKAELWNVLVDEDYREFNRDFRSSVMKLEAAAKAKNFDNATLQWMDTVKACVECHKYVRTQRPKLK